MPKFAILKKQLIKTLRLRLYLLFFLSSQISQYTDYDESNAVSSQYLRDLNHQMF